jgi:hypothetical protein
MPGMRVLDAHVYIGCRHLPALKVHHQLTLAGIEGAMLITGPETLDLPYSYPGAAEVADCWRHPRYLTRRGNFHSQKCSHPWLAPIPATPTHLGCVSRSHQLRPYDNLDLIDDILMLADGNESLTQCPRERIVLSSHTGGVTGARPRILRRLLPLRTFLTRHLKICQGEMLRLRVLGGRRMVSTGRLAIWGAVQSRWFR